jgi:glycosyltransferase involved in cell wall biosynthesis
MYEGCRVGVVVPAYDEETQIATVIDSMPKFVDRVIVVDDCSRDSTLEICRRYEAKSKGRLSVIAQPANAGVGAAIKAGYRKAIDEGLDVVAVMAGDGQMDPADLPALLDPVVSGEADYSKANRLFTGEAWKKTPPVRYFGNSVLSMLTKIASGYWHVADSQSGYTAISKKALLSLDLDRIYPSYGYPNQLLVDLNINNQRVRDVPLHPRYGIGERSSMKVWKVIPVVSLLLLRGFAYRLLAKYVIRDFHPLVFFYFLGIVFVVVGGALGILETALKLFTGEIALATIVLVALLLISGLQFLLFAMLFDMEYNRALR